MFLRDVLNCTVTHCLGPVKPAIVFYVPCFFITESFCAKQEEGEQSLASRITPLCLHHMLCYFSKRTESQNLFNARWFKNKCCLGASVSTWLGNSESPHLYIVPSFSRPLKSFFSFTLPCTIQTTFKRHNEIMNKRLMSYRLQSLNYKYLQFCCFSFISTYAISVSRNHKYFFSERRNWDRQNLNLLKQWIVMAITMNEHKVSNKCSR